MSKKLLRLLFTIFVIGGMFLSAVQPIQTVKAQTTSEAPVAQTNPGPEVEPQLLSQIEQDGSAGYLIYFRNKADLSAASGMDWQARGYFVMNALQQAADKAQANVRAYLDAQGVKYQSFWIDNIISVKDSSLGVFNELQNFPEIASLRAHRVEGLIEPEETAEDTGLTLFSVEPNITHVGAPDAWALGINGEGMVVSSIDTGVRYTHQALVNHYRGSLGGGLFDNNYNWWDPYGDHPASPADDNGHGTHTMGTMVGDDGGANQIGMAPGAQWMACRGCNTSSCSDSALLECAQFLVAPTDLTGANPDPDKRPDAINNSWGDCSTSYDGWYQGVVDAWLASGIYPIFSNGNASNCGYSSPPPCGTVGNPGRYGNVTGVGSTGQSNGAYASHSNRGPTDNPDTINPNGFPSIKPQVAAPGVNIRSSVNTSDTSYEGGWTGTSMSAPHVTGLVALVWQAAPCLVGDYAATETLIQDTATHITTGLPGSCSGEGPGQYPNQSTGWGEINAFAAVTAAMGACGPTGTLDGTVTASAGGDPLEDVTIEATGLPAQTYTTQTGPDGTYVFDPISAGTYEVTASKFGYFSDTATGVVVSADTITTLDFSLEQAPSSIVDGYVKDSLTGWPLYARIDIDGSPDSPFWTNPTTGYYNIELPNGAAYDFHVSAWSGGYNTQDWTSPVLSGALTHDFGLEVDPEACTAPGYKPGISYFENFENSDGGFTVDASSVNSTWAWGVPTSGPGSAHSGLNVWATNLSSSYLNYSDDYLVSPNIDLSGLTGEFKLDWWQWLQTESCCDVASVQVSNDGGAFWTTVYQGQGDVDLSWTERSVNLDASYAVTNFRVRFYLHTDVSITYPGWYIDDLAILGACMPMNGGLVVGNVYDLNTGEPLPGSVVTADTGEAVTVADTPQDPNVDDAFYLLFVPDMGTLLNATPPATQVPLAPPAGWQPVVDQVSDAAAAGPAPANMSGPTWAMPNAVLWNNGPLVTHPATCSGQDASRLQDSLGMTILGFGDQYSVGNRMADDFTITDPAG